MNSQARGIHQTESYHENGQLHEKDACKDGEWHGPYERYQKDGILLVSGTQNMGVKCGEWIEDGETVTYPPCPPGLADGN